MKKLLLCAAFAGSALFSNAQVIVRGVSPASIVQNYDFTWADNWGQTFDLSIPGNFVQDTLMMVNDGSQGTNPQGNPVSAEGCNTLQNDLTGKIAVIYRNTCEFGLKALNAQDAGAVGVIIINRDPEVIAMGGGVSGGSVTIPVVMLSSTDGATLVAEMANGPVEVFMGNKAGLFANDLGTSMATALLPKSYGVNSLVSTNASEFNFDLGLRLYNYGTAAQSAININATITNGSGTTVYDNNAGPISLAGINAGAIDSIDILPGETFSLPQFGLASYPAGRYTLTYTISDANNPTDDYAADNVITTDFVINDSIWSYATLDATSGVTDPNNFYKSSTATTSFTSCVHFRDPNASRIGVWGIYGAVSTGTANPISLVGEQLTAIVYQWNDPFTDLNDVTADNITELAIGEYFYAADLQNETVYVPLSEPIVLEDNQRYLFCIQTYNMDWYLGYDTKVNYLWNEAYYLQPVSVIEVDGTWYASGFGADVVSSVAAKTFDAASVGLNPTEMVAGSAFPNPATDKVTLTVEAQGNAVLTITDIAGRTVGTETLNFNAGSADVNIAALSSGVYVFNVKYEDGKTSQFNVVRN